jgi:glutathione S-transferase
MTLTLHYHPLSSYCWKVLIGLYENATPFTPVLLDLGDPAARAAFLALWPLGKMPVLRDEVRRETVPESSIILDYLDRYYPGRVRFTPGDPDLAWKMRLWDRVLDLHVHQALQKIVGDKLRPEGRADAHGVAEARAQLAAAYDLLESQLAAGPWLAGAEFGLADCAAAPALYYADRVEPLGSGRPAVAAYLDRLKARPSFARVLVEAEPYFHMFPG